MLLSIFFRYCHGCCDEKKPFICC